MHKIAYASMCIRCHTARLQVSARGLRTRPMRMTALDKWYEYLKSHDRDLLWSALHPDAVFESPVVHTPQLGRDITFKYLASAEKVLGGPGFKYVGEWRNESGAVLEFENEVQGIKIN